MSAWAAYLCATRGYHVRSGYSTSTTSTTSALWHRYCDDCGADLSGGDDG